MIRLVARHRGVHVDIAVRTGQDKYHLGLCGNLVMRSADWSALKGALIRGRVESDAIDIAEPKDEA